MKIKCCSIDLEADVLNKSFSCQAIATFIIDGRSKSIARPIGITFSMRGATVWRSSTAWRGSTLWAYEEIIDGKKLTSDQGLGRTIEGVEHDCTSYILNLTFEEPDEEDGEKVRIDCSFSIQQLDSLDIIDNGEESNIKKARKTERDNRRILLDFPPDTNEDIDALWKLKEHQVTLDLRTKLKHLGYGLDEISALAPLHLPL